MQDNPHEVHELKVWQDQRAGELAAEKRRESKARLVHTANDRRRDAKTTDRVHAVTAVSQRHRPPH